ncbi:MAG: outer membrane protein transport protein [Chlorobi bacterium]|nr:outer membrane protein transport protein [Chlorobiota bacterium]MCI0715240.1 outer membrane protein transport protein [Chlorobiota bacterium]
MNLLTKITILIFAVLAFASASFGQVDKNGGSLYSIYGLGDLNYSASNRTDAMGILGLALYGDYTNSLNPASWTRIQSTIFSSKFSLDNIRSTDGINNAERTYGNFEGFNLSIPLNKGNGWIFDLGLNNYSLVNYDARFSSSIEGEEYTQTYSGNGGLNRLSLGFSYIIFRHFSFGAQFNYAFGNINKSLIIDFTNPALFDTKNYTSNTIWGLYFNTGLIFHGFGKVFNNKKLDKLTLGVYFSTPAKFDSEITGKFNRSVNNIDSLSISEGNLDIPLSFGAGISNEFNDKLILAADVLLQQWDNYKYYGSHPTEIKNNLRAGLGMEYTPSKKLEDSYLKRISYRLGASYTADYLKINNENINSISLSAGLSLPIGRYNALDLYFKYITRGKSSNGLIKDDVFRFGASVKIGELWFLKPSEDF